MDAYEDRMTKPTADPKKPITKNGRRPYTSARRVVIIRLGMLQNWYSALSIPKASPTSRPKVWSFAAAMITIWGSTGTPMSPPNTSMNTDM